MSATNPPSLDLQEQAARIDKTLAENQKLLAETSKLLAEQVKLQAEALKMPAETEKLRAEARKFGRESTLQVLLAVTGLLGGLVTVARLLWPMRGGG